MGKVIDLTGKKFGRLTVIERVGVDKKKSATWLCKCDCGNKKVASRDNLQKGHTQSCGCLHSEESSIAAKQTAIKQSLRGTRINNLKEKISKNNKTGIKGISFERRSGKYEAYITFQRKKIFLGYFDKLEDAADSRKKAEEKYFKPILQQSNNSEKD